MKSEQQNPIRDLLNLIVEFVFVFACISNNIIIILARKAEIGQGLGRILSCGVRKPEQT